MVAAARRAAAPHRPRLVQHRLVPPPHVPPRPVRRPPQAAALSRAVGQFLPAAARSAAADCTSAACWATAAAAIRAATPAAVPRLVPLPLAPLHRPAVLSRRA